MDSAALKQSLFCGFCPFCHLEVEAFDLYGRRAWECLSCNLDFTESPDGIKVTDLTN